MRKQSIYKLPPFHMVVFDFRDMSGNESPGRGRASPPPPPRDSDSDGEVTPEDIQLLGAPIQNGSSHDEKREFNHNLGKSHLFQGIRLAHAILCVFYLLCLKRLSQAPVMSTGRPVLLPGRCCMYPRQCCSVHLTVSLTHANSIVAFEIPVCRYDPIWVFCRKECPVI